MVDWAPFDLFGRHVPSRTHDLARIGINASCRDAGLRLIAIGAGELGQPKIKDLHPSVIGDKEILRLEIAMHDSLFMSRRQTMRDLQCIVDRLTRWQRRAT